MGTAFFIKLIILIHIMIRMIMGVESCGWHGGYAIVFGYHLILYLATYSSLLMSTSISCKELTTELYLYRDNDLAYRSVGLVLWVACLWPYWLS